MKSSLLPTPCSPLPAPRSSLRAPCSALPALCSLVLALCAQGATTINVQNLNVGTITAAGGGGGGGGSTAFVTGQTLGSTRNNFGDFVGLQMTIDSANDLTVTDLGRWVVSGNSGTHTVKVTDMWNQTVGSVSVNTSGATPAAFKYTALGASITLGADHIYYLWSAETNGGDSWYDDPTTVSHTAVAVVNDSAYFFSGIPNLDAKGTDHSYVPVDFKYTTATPGSAGSTTRDGYSGGTAGSDLVGDAQGPGQHDMLAVQFTAGATYTANKAVLRMHKTGSPTLKIAVALFSNASGSPGSLIGTGSAAIAESGLGSSEGDVTFTGLSASLTSGTVYWLVIAVSKLNVGDGINYVRWDYTSSAVNTKYSADGSTWNAYDTSTAPKFTLFSN